MDTQGYSKHRETVEKIKAVAVSIKTCELSASSAADFLTPLNVDDEGMLWFFGRSTEETEIPNIRQDDEVRLVFDNHRDVYMAIYGHVDVFDGFRPLIRVHPDK